jgi:hypothetical protein
VLLRVVPGDQIEVAHIGHFAAFYQALLAAARPPGYQVVGPPLPMPDQPDGWPHQWQ